MNHGGHHCCDPSARPQSAKAHGYIPVFCGGGGGTTKGLRTVLLAKDVESQGAMGVVLNAPMSDLNLLAVSKAANIPVIITITCEDTDVQARLENGASILNIACGHKTPEVVKEIRAKYLTAPLIASGGKTNETVHAAIQAGRMPLPVRRHRRRSFLRRLWLPGRK